MTERERIAALIQRSDFQTAETLMRKSALPPETRRELRKAIEQRKRQKERDLFRKRRRERFARRLRKFNAHSWKGFLTVFFLLGVMTVYYNCSAYIRSLDSWDGPPFRRSPLMELLNLLAALDMVLFWGLVVLEAVLDRLRWSLEHYRGVFLFWLLVSVLYLFRFLYAIL